LRNFRYLKIVHHPGGEKLPYDVDFIVDGNDVKIFLLGGSFTPKLTGEKITLGFTKSLQTKFRKSSISRTSFCDSTKNYVVCQQLMPDNQEASASTFTNNNLAVLAFPKVNTNPIKDLQTDTIYSKSVADLDFGANPVALLNNLFATNNYEEDEMVHLSETGNSFDVVQLATPFKLTVKNGSDVSKLGLEVYPLITSDAA